MRVVLDTNVLLVSIAPNSVFRPIFDALLAKKYTLVKTASRQLTIPKTRPFSLTHKKHKIDF